MIEIINWEIHWTLNMPPSMNWLFSWKEIRHKSDEYQGFEKYVMVEFAKCDDRPKITWDEWLEVEYDFYFSLYTKKWVKRIKDTFNFEKALTDTLGHRIEWFDDHKIKRWIVEKHDSDKNIVKFIIREVK